MWDNAQVKAILRLPRFPQRLLEHEPLASWIAQRGGMTAVRSYLRTVALSSQQRRVLELILARPMKSATVYADSLDIGLSTYFKYLHELVPLLAEHLNSWQLAGQERSVDNPPPLLRPAPVPTNVPAPLTSLVGADALIQKVVSLLQRDSVRLITLLGPGGAGKSRLAVQVARQLLAATAGHQPVFPDGTYFIDLAVVDDPALVPAQIAQTLQLAEHGETPLSLLITQFFAERQLLLVLDNLEHLLAAATLITQLLSTAPGLKIIATSRSALNLYGEHKVVVPPLTIPDLAELPAPAQLLEYSAVRLFVERAFAASANFELTRANSAAVAQICTHLDGLPLAIELAAARCSMLTPAALLPLLQQRLAILTHGPIDRPARHQSVRNAIDWSYQLLSAGEKALLNRLSVFSKGWTVAAMEQVCWDEEPDQLVHAPASAPQQQRALEQVLSLVDKSLVQRQESGTGTRFAMLEIIREYAAEQLAESGQTTTIRQRHVAYYLGLVEQVEGALGGPMPGQAVAEMELEHDNVRAALSWAIEQQQRESALRFVGALWTFWKALGLLSEGRYWAGRALALHPQEPGAPRLKALWAAGWLALFQKDSAQAQIYFEEGHGLAQALADQRGLGRILQGLGELAYGRKELERAVAYFNESLAVHRELGDGEEVAWVLDHLGSLALVQGAYDQGRRYISESLQLFRQQGHQMGIAHSVAKLGAFALEEEQYGAAVKLLTQSLELMRAVGERWDQTWVLENLGRAALGQGDLEYARQLLHESLRTQVQLNLMPGICYVIEGCGILAIMEGQIERGLRMVAAVHRYFEQNPRTAQSQIQVERMLAEARSQIDQQTFQKAWEGGESMALTDVIIYALANSAAEDEQGVRHGEA